MKLPASKNRQAIVVAFLSVATVVYVFLWFANYILLDVVYWPTLVVTLPALPLIAAGSFLFGNSSAMVYYTVIPALMWGGIAAGITWLVKRRAWHTSERT